MMEGNDLLSMLEEFAKFVETVTGMRQQLLEKGWSQDHAEEVVIIALRGGGG